MALITLLVLITSCVKRGKKVYNRTIRIDIKNRQSTYVIVTLTLNHRFIARYLIRGGIMIMLIARYYIKIKYVLVTGRDKF